MALGVESSWHHSAVSEFQTPKGLRHASASSSSSASWSSSSAIPRPRGGKEAVHVGVLQMPRTRGERWRHLQVLGSVPFELVPAYDERMRLNARRHAVAGSVGKILRRHRKDSSTVLLQTMLKACVEKRQEPLLWDTITESLRSLAFRLPPEDLGLALACLMKANYRRDADLIANVIRRLASVMSTASAPSSKANASSPSFPVLTATSMERQRQQRQAAQDLAKEVVAASGRRHRRVLLKTEASAAVRNPAAVGTAAVSPPAAKRAVGFAEHALCSGLVAAHHWGLGEVCADAVAKLCAQAQRRASSISDRTLCRIAHTAGALAGAGVSSSSGAHGGVVSNPGSTALNSDGGSASQAGSCAPAARRLLRALQPELRARLVASASGCTIGAVEDDDDYYTSIGAAEVVRGRRHLGITAGDLCMVAHAYGHTRSPATEYRDLFDALAERITNVVLLQLSVTELAGLANSFGKLSQAEDLGYVGFYDRLGRQLAASTNGQSSSSRAAAGGDSAPLGLRTCCVALNAFAQASVRHEPLFFAFGEQLPHLLQDRECDMRQLAMLAHAHVRVGLSHSSLLPLLWQRATGLAQRSDAHSVSLMLFAVTKASAAAPDAGPGGGGGRILFAALGQRLMALIGRGKMQPATVAMTTYALARSGCAAAVDVGLWQALAAAAALHMERLSLSEAANVAAALAQVARDPAAQLSGTETEVEAFFANLRERIERELQPGAATVTSRGGDDGVSPMVAAKFIMAFGDLRRDDSASTVLRLARHSLGAAQARHKHGAQNLGVGPLRGVAEALTRLRIFDEDLILAITAAQRQQQPRGAAAGVRRRPESAREGDVHQRML